MTVPTVTRRTMAVMKRYRNIYGGSIRKEGLRKFVLYDRTLRMRAWCYE